MPDDPWGENDPPAVDPLPPLPARLAEMAAVTETVKLPAGERFVRPKPEDLIEVQELMAAGWRPLDDNPMWRFLPAVWPPALRCWVPDRVPRFNLSTTMIQPWPSEVHDDMRRQDAELMDRFGLPAPPPGRIWLLRSPWPSVGVAAVISIIGVWVAERGAGDRPGPARVEAAREVFGWDEDGVWAWWPGERGDVPEPGGTRAGWGRTPPR